MKQIKYIPSFLLLLILQLCLANSFASVFSNECLCVNNIEFSEIGILNSDFSELSFKENNIFEASFLDVVPCLSISFCGGYAELVDAWRLLDEAGVSNTLKKC